MILLLEHETGRALEPSAGEGHLVALIEGQRSKLEVVAVELDETLEAICQAEVTQTDFFTYAEGREECFEVIVGNPPYVPWKDVRTETRAAASTVKAKYSGKVNLYQLFIDRCIDLLVPGGELIFIVPKEWLYLTSAGPLRQKLAASGSVTHLVDCGEERLFADASVPALLIFRFVKGDKPQPFHHYASLQDHLDARPSEKVLAANSSRWRLLPSHTTTSIEGWGTLGDAIDVKVGLVTGCDHAFRVPPATRLPRSCIQPQVTTKKTSELFIDVNHISTAQGLPDSIRDHLEPHREALLARRIAEFDEGNWWRYGAIRNAEAMASNRPRLYVLAKTRDPKPFFTHPAKHYTGGVLGLFLKEAWWGVRPEDVATLLNSKLYREIFEGFFLTTGNKVSFQPATLSDIPFPRTPTAFEKALQILGASAEDA